LRNDGSIYLGPRYENIEILKQGSKISQNNLISIKYNEGQQISDPNILKNFKVSFHGSGIINTRINRFVRQSIRYIKEQQMLCMMLFHHPSQYSPVYDVRKRDICLNYSIDEKRPLCGSLYISPSDKIQIVKQSSALNQINLILNFSNLINKTCITLQLILFHGVEGPWPPYSYIVFMIPSKEKNNNCQNNNEIK